MVPEELRGALGERNFPAVLTQVAYGGPLLAEGRRARAWLTCAGRLCQIWQAVGRPDGFVSNSTGNEKAQGVCVKAERAPRTHGGRLCQVRRLLGVCVRREPRATCHKRPWLSSRPARLPQAPVAFPLPRPFATSARGFPGERSVGQTPPEFVPPACAYTISTGKRFVSAVAITPATSDGWHSMHAAHVTFTH